eukprot:m.47094 g.47094  ORF g.47094 m.47094 type:complete len:66 (+) comp13200_c0_seq1:28-225(+)
MAGGGWIGWVDSDNNRILVRAENVTCVMKKADGSYFVNANGNKDENILELNVFKSLEDAYVWMTL